MNSAAFLSDLIARGVEFMAEGDKVRFRPMERLTPDEIEVMREHKAEILKLLRNNSAPGSVVIEAPETWFEESSRRHGGLCSPPITPIDPHRWIRCLSRCDRCGSNQFNDVPIHNGRSLRRDCSECHRFIGWPRWYDQLFDSLN